MVQTNLIKQLIQDFRKTEFQQDLISWFRKEQRDLPWRKDKDPYKIWVSEIMLQQTRVDTVIPYFYRFIEKFPTPKHLAYADEQEVLKVWEGLGYYSRARNLQSAVKEVVENYDCKVPNDKKELSNLKGVGPYTTGAILSIAYNQPEPAVDGNVMRVMSRIFSIWEDISKVKTRKLFESVVKNIISTEYPSDFNQALMELGAIVCTPTSPSCLLCPVREYCCAFHEGVQEDLPVKAKKKPPKEIYLNAVVLMNEEDKVLIQKRPDKGLLANLWEFPNYEIVDEFDPHEQTKQYMKEQFQLSINDIRYLTTVKHVFSHLVWNISVYKGSTTGNVINDQPSCLFVDLGELKNYPFPVSYQKIIQEVMKNQT